MPHSQSERKAILDQLRKTGKVPPRTSGLNFPGMTPGELEFEELVARNKDERAAGRGPSVEEVLDPERIRAEDVEARTKAEAKLAKKGPTPQQRGTGKGRPPTMKAAVKQGWDDAAKAAGVKAPKMNMDRAARGVVAAVSQATGVPPEVVGETLDRRFGGPGRQIVKVPEFGGPSRQIVHKPQIKGFWSKVGTKVAKVGVLKILGIAGIAYEAVSLGKQAMGVQADRIARETPIRSKEILRREMEMQGRLQSRRSSLAQDTQLMDSVLVALGKSVGGGGGAKITKSQTALGSAAGGGDFSPDQLEGFLDQYLQELG